MGAADDEVMAAVSAFFEAGKSGDFGAMRRMLGEGFTSFGDVPPYGVRDADTTVVLEEMRLASISDYGYGIHGERILISGDAAVATFALRQTGMLVDNKTFSGRTIDSESRATFALVRRGAWKIVHIHVSRAPR